MERRDFKDFVARLILGRNIPGHIRPPLRVLLVQRFRRNLGLRAIAIVLAIGLWFFVNAGQRGALASISVPISYRAIPAGLVIVNQRPDYVHLEVRGPRTLLSLLDPDRLVLRLDLSSVTPGQAVIKIGPEMFNVPRQTDVTRISPSQIVLDIDRWADRQIPIHVDLQGQPAPGYRISSVKANPSTTTVRGPTHILARLDNVQTLPVDVSGSRSDLAQPVPLAAPGDHMVIVGAKMVEASVAIGEVVVNRDFHALAVEVRDTDYKAKVEPRAVSVVLRGPLNKLSGIDLRGSVYVSAEEVTPGLHKLPVQVELPEGVQLVHAMPQNVRVRIYREKRDANG
jgi:hypothetical protein